MIKTIFVPISIKYTNYEYASHMTNGTFEQLQAKAEDARLEAENKLNTALGEGYTILHASTIDTTRSVDFAFVLYKASTK